MRLRTALIGLLVVVAVVLSGTIYLGFALHKDEVVAQERQQVETVADVVATDVESQLSSRREGVDLWAGNDQIRAGTSAERRRELATFVDRTQFSGASIIAANGTMVALRSMNLTREQAAAIRGQNFSNRSYVRAALDGRTFVSDPFDADTGNRIVAISTPIHAEGRIVGVLTGSLHLSSGPLFTNTPRISQADNRIRISDGNRTVFGQSSGRLSDPLTATASVDGTNWTVTAFRDRSDLTAELQQATLLQFGGVVVALLAVALLGLWVFRRTVTQIDTLRQGLDALEQGDYTHDLELADSEEWQAISDRYDSLGDTLEQRDSQLQVLNRVLRHNLRNDMNVITAHAESALAAEETPDDIAENISQIHATARRLIDTSEHARVLYEDLLSRETRDPEPVDVVDIVSRRVETLRAEFPECTIETDHPDSVFACDTAVLPIVVEEVAHNAIVHNDRPESERRVDITVETVRESDLSSDGEVRIEVTDNGPGIPMVEEALLTDELDETPVEHGSGLGVWLVNWLVAQLGGTVEAHSGIESGTTVSIRVPAAPPETDA